MVHNHQLNTGRRRPNGQTKLSWVVGRECQHTDQSYNSTRDVYCKSPAMVNNIYFLMQEADLL